MATATKKTANVDDDDPLRFLCNVLHKFNYLRFLFHSCDRYDGDDNGDNGSFRIYDSAECFGLAQKKNIGDSRVASRKTINHVFDNVSAMTIRRSCRLHRNTSDAPTLKCAIDALKDFPEKKFKCQKCEEEEKRPFYLLLFVLLAGRSPSLAVFTYIHAQKKGFKLMESEP